jgi:outer membrane protein assembly factor BamB
VAQDGWVIATTASELLALRLDDGAVAWRQPRAETDKLSARPTLDAHRIYVPLADGRVEARELATGATAWSLQLGGAPSEILVSGDRLYVGSDDRYVYSLALADGALKWRYRLGGAVRGQPATDGTRVFVVALDHLTRAFDSGNGARKWNKGVPYRPAAGPLVAGGTVLVAGPAAELVTFDAATGQPGPRFPVGGVLQGAPALGALAGERLLAAIIGDLASGWTLAIFDSSYSIPVVPLTALPGEVVPIAIPQR